jgi:pyrroline-5-carboxylate reductase
VVTALLGCGRLGEALLSGLLRAGHAPASIVVVDSPARVEELVAAHGVTGATAAQAVTVAELLIVAVKPGDVPGLLAELAPAVDPGRHLLVSVAAGVPTATLEALLPQGTPVVRVMPNTPALVGEGMSAVAAGASATGAHLDAVEAVLRTVGRVLRIPEGQLDAVTAVSGSGPAYVLFLVEAMTDAGVLLGLPRAIALELVTQTVLGTGLLLRETGEHPAQLREAVTSPGGTTAAALRELERHGVRAAFLDALEAARDRSRALAAAAG